MREFSTGRASDRSVPCSFVAKTITVISVFFACSATAWAEEATQAPAPCAFATGHVQDAIRALKALELVPSNGSYAWPPSAAGTPTSDDFQKQLDSDPLVRDATSRLTFLLLNPDKGSDALCPTAVIDQWDRNTYPAGVARQTLLTSAIRTGNPILIQLAIKIVKDQKGNLFATNNFHIPGNDPKNEPAPQTAHQVAIALAMPMGEKAYASVMTPLEPQSIEWPLKPPSKDGVPKYGDQIWDRLQTSGNPGPISPDVNDQPSRIPPYVNSLILSGQGLSIGATSQAGTTSPKIQGELRYTLHYLPDLEEKNSDRLFLILNANINSNKDPSKPTNPDWAGAGIGFKYLASPRYFGTNLRWSESRAKFGVIDNLLSGHHATYAVANVASSVFVPLAHDLGEWSKPIQETRPGAAAYASGTVGAQAQSRLSGIEDPGQPSTYTFERLDLYAYPWTLVGRLAGTDCPNFITDTLEGKCSSITVHLDRQVVNRGIGRLNEAALSWEFRPGLSISLSRSIGVQDPIATFGLRLPRTAQTQLSLKVQPTP